MGVVGRGMIGVTKVRVVILCEDGDEAGVRV